MQSEIEKLKTIFDTNNIPASIAWLEQCVQWCKTEILRQGYTFDQLKEQIHEQWLVQDLREIDTAVLPPNLSEKKYMILNGNYSLQMMQIVDISKPKYWQLQQIRKENILTRPNKYETNESVGTGKRVLQLTLTDGVQYIEAMEYKPIRNLNINLTPGIKVRLSAPLTIRRGRLMLLEQNIRILGGEVESLLISNAAENILARALNLPENPDPQVVDANLLSVDQEQDNVNRENFNNSNSNNRQHLDSRNNRNNTEISRIAETNNQVKTTRSIEIGSAQQQGSNRNAMIDDYPTDEDFEMLMAEENLLRNENTININQRNSVQARNTNFSQPDRFEDPYDENIELLMEVERDLETSETTTNRKTLDKTPELFDDDFDADPDQIDRLVEMTKNKEKDNLENIGNTVVQRKETAPQTSTLKKNIPKSSLFDEFINEDDLFGNLDLDNLDAKKEEENSKSDIISITKLLQTIQRSSEGLFKIRAKFKSVVEKLTLQKEEYKLSIMVEDEMNEMVCRVHSDVVSGWAGLTPSEIMNLKASIFSQNVESKKKIEKALQNIKDQLLETNHVMEIEINGKDSAPIIKNIFY